MRFSSQPDPTGAIQCAIQYKPGSEDGELVALFADAIRALVAVVYKARTRDVSVRSEADRWTSEFLLGYAILTVNEARSLLLLLGGGLNRHARVHGRSLWEHELHARRLVEDETNVLALKLRDAYAFEARVFGHLTGADPNAVERSIAHAIGVDDSASDIREFEAEFGRSDRIDATLLNELQKLQVRLAAVTARQTRTGSGEPKVAKYVEQIGDVTVHLATDNALELFAQIDEQEYLGYGHGNSTLGRKGYDPSVLEKYNVVDDPKPARPNAPASTIEDEDIVCLHEEIEPFEDDVTRGACA